MYSRMAASSIRALRMRSALDLFIGEQAEPAFDEIEPGTTGRGEVEMEPGPTGDERCFG